MRPKKRINIFFKYCNTAKKMEKYLIWLDIVEGLDTKHFAKLIMDYKKGIKDEWKKNQDLRFTQALISMSILPNYPGFWYHKEEEVFLIEVLGIPREKVSFWGNNYDKNMKPMKKTRWILIEDMTREHLEAIIKLVDEKKMRINDDYEDTFRKRLTL